MNAQDFGHHLQLKPSVILTGTAKEGSAGPPIGLFDVSEGAYLVQVALPGVWKDQCHVNCKIQREGRVDIEGEVADFGFLKHSSTVYKMRVQQLCPPGPFTISFNLPGPVEPRFFSPTFRPDGILVIVVTKCKETPSEGEFLLFGSMRDKKP